MKRLPLLLMLLVLLIAARSERNVNLQAGDTVHCTADALVLTSAVDAHCAAFTPTPTATPVAVLTATSTSTSTPAPTATDTATPMPTATATDTPQPTSTPLAGMPLCPSHDPTVWHALIDTTRQCHYDHEHGDDPALADSVFGPVQGSTIGFPWQTSSFEPVAKHAGYKYFVNRNMPCDPAMNYLGVPAVNCITDTRIEFHIVSSIMDGNARYHSYRAEYRVCQNGNFAQCGTVAIGGWADYGVLNSPYSGPRVCRTGGSLYFGQLSLQGGGGYNNSLSYPADALELDQIATCGQVPPQPYVAMANSGVLTVPGTIPQDVWNMNGLLAPYFGHNPYAEFIVRTFDSWGYVDTVNPNAINFFCRDGACSDNGSNRAQAGGSVHVLAAWDSDSDGFADYSGFTDRYGNTVSGCTAISLDCVPFAVVHAPVGYAHYDSNNCQCQDTREYDTSPAGQHWIAFPN